MARLLLMIFAALVVVAPPAFGAEALPAADPAPSTRAFKKKKDKQTEEEKSEEEKRIEEEEERKRRELLARVIVLKWRDGRVDSRDETVRSNVRSRIDRSEAMFFPEVDLYQNGRKVPDRTVIAANQPAIVPDTNIAAIEARALQVLSLPWDTYTTADWYGVASGLRETASSVWFIDRPELRKPVFLLYAAIGYAADNADNPGPPFFEGLGGETVNYYYYQAALLALGEPALVGHLAGYADPTNVIEYLLGRLRQGGFPSYKIDFEQETVYDPVEFDKDYEVLINGLPATLDANARTDLFLGRNDIYMRRNDTGHGLSERLEFTKLEDKAYFVRDVARKRMGIEFIDQLFLNPNACLPEVDGDILNYLAIYQKLHSKADIYIAAPKNDNPNKVWIWMYEKERAQLKYIGGGDDAFPVRFALLFSSGMLYNGASPVVDANLSDESSLAPGDVASPNRFNVEKEPAMIPFEFELRGHYNRLMVNIGAEFGYNAGKNAQFQEYYQTPGKQKEEDIYTARHSDCEPVVTAEDGEEVVSYRCDVTEVYNRRTFNRHLYLGAGIVLGRDAALGFGPRFAAQWGWTNMPHGWQTTGHFGWAIQPKFLPHGDRVRPLIDLDLRAGMAIPRPRSLQFDLVQATKSSDQPERLIEPVLGATAGVGFTF